MLSHTFQVIRPAAGAGDGVEPLSPGSVLQSQGQSPGPRGRTAAPHNALGSGVEPPTLYGGCLHHEQLFTALELGEEGLESPKPSSPESFTADECAIHSRLVKLKKLLIHHPNTRLYPAPLTP